jgi:hypothetical protein
MNHEGVHGNPFHPKIEEEWVKQHQLRQEAEHDKFLESMNPKDIMKAVEVIREWFPGMFTERGERIAVALLLEGIKRHGDNPPNPSELATVPSFIFSCVPGIHKTRKGLIHQYRGVEAVLGRP